MSRMVRQHAPNTGHPTAITCSLAHTYPVCIVSRPCSKRDGEGLLRLLTASGGAAAKGSLNDGLRHPLLQVAVQAQALGGYASASECFRALLKLLPEQSRPGRCAADVTCVLCFT